MNLKKLSSVVLSCVMAGALFTGCGGGESTANTDTTKNTQQTSIGIISKLNVDEKTFNQNTNKLEESIKIPGVNISHKYIYYKNFESMLADLKSQKIDELSTYRSVANYICGKNPDLEISNHTVSMSDKLCLAVRKEDTALLDSLNNALKVMDSEGTTAYIIKTYIYYLNPNDETPVTDMPQINSPETIKVGVTGDFPPFDMVKANGTPEGFCTTLLAELSRRTQKNIEIVKISAGERANALNSKKIDVAFWTTVPDDNLKQSGSFTKGIDKPDNIEVTMPYFEDEIVHVVLKK